MNVNIKLLLCISLVFIPCAYAETVYKTVDADGNTVFSDLKTDGAEIIKIQEAQSISSPEISSFKATPEKTKPKKPNYTKLEIISPENDSTVHHGSGDLSVTVNLEPELKENDTMLLFVDGEQRLSGRSSELLLTNVDRGSHAIDVAVINENDEVLIRSDKVVVHLRRMSRLFPNFPKDPPPEAIN